MGMMPVILLSLMLSQGATQEPPESEAIPRSTGVEGVEPTAALDFLASWKAGREKLSDAGISFNVNLTIDGGYNLTGGNQTGGFVIGLLDTAIQFDTKKLMGLDGGTILVRWQLYEESNPQPYQLVNDYWGYESVDSRIGDLNQLSECYYEQNLFDDRLTIVFGKQDALNWFLNPLGTTGYFVSNVDAYPSTMVPFVPTYPDQAMGLVLMGKPTNWLELKTAWFDGTNAYSTNGSAPGSTGSLGPGSFFDNPGSWFFISEADFSWAFDGGLEGNASVGAWFQTGPSTVVATNTPPNQAVVDFNGGWYLQATQRLFNPDPSATTPRGVRLYSQLGWGDPSRNPANWSIAGGFAFDGPLPGRDRDSFGVSVGYTTFSDSPSVYQSTDGLYEFVFEAYYNIAITNWMSLQPDIQVLTTPLNQSELPTAVVGILRLSINF